MRSCRFKTLVVCWSVLLAATAAFSDAPQAPDAFIGHEVGADYRLARWEVIVDYFRHVGERSDRVRVVDLGETTAGLPMIHAEVSSAETIADLAPHRENQRKIADPRTIRDEAEARRLTDESKVVLLVNCSLHSTEVAASQMAMELLYELATSDAPRIREILDRTIILLVPSANPDGLNMVIDWYESSRNTPWEGGRMPWLYQEYAGHDNNRDWYMLNLIETRHLTRLIYEIWRPTIVYDVHQMGNRTARFFVPPFHDPKNANVPPLVDHTLLIIGGQMAQELSLEGRTGVVHGAIYDNWWAGGFRTTVYRHNMVGILTEAASANIASPIFQRKSQLRGARRGLPTYDRAVNFPEPWPGGWWRLRDIVDYEKTACVSLFTYAARYHDRLQGNYLHLGREAIERGTSEPPHAWLVPPDQRDPASAIWMLEALQATGIEIHRATESFEADGVEYPADTFVLYTAQPYRPHLMDMMERQDYPDRETYPGGPAEPPYDMAGWTLPLQMGVRHVAVAKPFEAKASPVERLEPPAGGLEGTSSAAGYLVAAGRNDDYRLLNRLHRAGIEVSVFRGGTEWKTAEGEAVSPGSLWISDTAAVREAGESLLDGVSTSLVGLGKPGSEVTRRLTAAPPPRVALYQPWTASMDEGWTRFVLDQFEFDYDRLHNAEIIAGNLAQRYDAIVLPSLSPESILEGRAPDTTAPPYVGGIGAQGVVRLQEFVQAGGTLVCIDASCNLLIEQFNIPVDNVIADKKTEEFFCPGSVLRVRLDPEHPLAYGMPEWVSGYFARSQAFALLGETASPQAKKKSDGQDDAAGSPAVASAESRDPATRFPTTVAGRYSDTVLLESGWIRGGELIRDRPAIVEVRYGAGRLAMLGFRVQNRGQPHGTFRLLFNAIQRSTLADLPES